MPRAIDCLRAVAVLLALVIATPSFGQSVDPSIAKLIEELSHPNAYARRDAASSIASRAAAAEGARRAELLPTVEPLLRALRDPEPGVRSTAALALGNLRQRPEATIPGLVALLRDEGTSVRLEAANSIARFGSAARAAVPSLLEVLALSDSDTCGAAARALAEIRTDASVVVPALLAKITAPQGADTCSADVALAKYGTDARAAVQALIKLLEGPDIERRRDAAYALAGIGSDAGAAAPALVAALEDERTRFAAARALAKIGKNRDQALRAFRFDLVAAHPRTREVAAWAMIDLDVEGEAGIPDLVRALRDGDGDVADAAALTLEKLARALRDGSRFTALPALRSAQMAIQEHRLARVRSHAAAITRDIEALEEIRRTSATARIQDLYEAYPTAFPILLLYVAAAVLWVSLYWLRPSALWRVNETLIKLPKIRLPGWLGGIEISLANLVLVGFLRHRDRVLDAWVAENIVMALSSLKRLQRERGIEPTSAQGATLLNDIRLPQLRASDLRPTFLRPLACVVIRARVGALADSIAWQIASWAAHPEVEYRLRRNLMIPVFMEGSFVSPGYTKPDSVVLAVREQLYVLDTNLPSTEFIKALLQRQRLLVIVLGLSEANEETRAALRPANPDFPAKALIVASSIGFSLGNVRHTIIEPVSSPSLTLVERDAPLHSDPGGSNGSVAPSAHF